jgi:hypothetical protein
MTTELKLPNPYTPVKLPQSILFNQSCKQIATQFAYSITHVAVNELTVLRNGESCKCVKRILAEPTYLGLAVLGAVETLARLVCAVVLIPVLGITYFIGKYCCTKLKELSAWGMTRLAGSVYISGIATADAAVCLVTNISCNPIHLKVFQKVYPPKHEIDEI